MKTAQMFFSSQTTIIRRLSIMEIILRQTDRGY